jgi:hypothetical protein
MRLNPRDAVRFSALKIVLLIWPELPIHIPQLARERSPPPGLRVPQAELSRNSQSDSSRTDSLVRVLPPQPRSRVSASQAPAPEVPLCNP